jgi:hypothetical protein
VIKGIALAIALSVASPAEAGCFLFIFCPPHAHHHRHHHHRAKRPPRVVQKVIVKKPTIARERKVVAAPDLGPIRPVK